MGWFGDLFKTGGKILKYGLPIVAAPWTGGASLAAYGAYGASSANKQNRDQAQKQMDFQERMRNTEVSARVQDLINSGLNPMLAYTDTASSPTGAMAQMRNTMEDMPQAITAATNAQTAKLQREQIEAQTNLIKTQTQDTYMAATVKGEQNEALRIENAINRMRIDPDMLPREKERLNAQIDAVLAQAKSAQNAGDISSTELQKVKELLPLIVREQTAKTRTTEAGVPEAEATADLWRKIESYGKGAGLSAKAIDLLKMLIKH